MRPLEGVAITTDFGVYSRTREVIYSTESESLMRVTLTEGGCPCGSVGGFMELIYYVVGGLVYGL